MTNQTEPWVDPVVGGEPVRPVHYMRYPIEPVRFIVENLGDAWLVGNIVKYVLRYDAKNGVRDLEKAERYLEMLKKRVQGDPDWWK